jgi:hypothetical protein
VKQDPKKIKKINGLETPQNKKKNTKKTHNKKGKNKQKKKIIKHIRRNKKNGI